MLNPWKQVRLLRGIIISLQDLVKSLQTVITTQGKMIALQQTRIETLLRAATVEKTSVVDLTANKFLN
jgi:hypothetical protein